MLELLTTHSRTPGVQDGHPLVGLYSSMGPIGPLAQFPSDFLALVKCRYNVSCIWYIIMLAKAFLRPSFGSEFLPNLQLQVAHHCLVHLIPSCHQACYDLTKIHLTGTFHVTCALTESAAWFLTARNDQWKTEVAPNMIIPKIYGVRIKLYQIIDK